MKESAITYRFEMPDSVAMDPARRIAGTTADLLRNHPSTVFLHIKDWQRYRGMSMKEASRKIGVSFVSYRNWHDNRHWPNSVWLPRMAAVFGCSIEELYFPPPGMRQQ